MASWDENSPELKRNLALVLSEIVQSAQQRQVPTVEIARRWQRAFMQGLKAADPKYAGAFRGEPGLEKTGVRIGGRSGAHPARVADQLAF